MKKLQKVMIFSLAILMALSLVACGGGTSSSAPATSGSGSAPAADDGDYIVGYIAKNTVDIFHATINSAAKTALDALVADGVITSWDLYDGQTDPITQNNLLEDALNKGSKCIIMLPAEAAGCDPMVERCAEAGVACIVVNSKTNNTDELATSYVGSDDVQAGEMMANYVIEQLPDGGGYGHLQGVIGNSAQIQRGEGLHNVMDARDDWTLLDGAEQGAEWQAEKAVKFAEDWLAKYGDQLNAIICDNDDMSSAVQAAMNAAGRSDIVCIGVDGNVGPLTMIKNGELGATVYQDGAGQVTTAINLIVDLRAGETVEKEIMVDFVLVTAENVDDYLAA